MKRSVSMVCFGTVVFAAYGCGTGDSGAWFPTDDSPNKPGGGYIVGKVPREITTEIPEPITDPIIALRCAVPFSQGLPQLLEGGEDLKPRATPDPTQFCFGESDALGQPFCQQIQGEERRFNAIADCYQRALQIVEGFGIDTIAGSYDKWQRIKHDLIPQAWAVSPSEVTDDVGVLQERVASLMTSPQEPSLAPTTLCFLKDANVDLTTARDEVLFSLNRLWTQRAEQSETILATLRRGLDVKMGANDDRLRIAVTIATVHPTPLAGECAFSIPSI